jgi:hypothetical protein
MGHKDIRTTQVCTDVLKLNGYAVTSPADKLWATALQRRFPNGSGKFSAARHDPGAASSPSNAVNVISFRPQ